MCAGALAFTRAAHGTKRSISPTDLSRRAAMKIEPKARCLLCSISNLILILYLVIYLGALQTGHLTVAAY